MAVVSCELHWNGSTGKHTASGGSYTAVYKVKTDDKLDQSQTIADYITANVADFGDSYEYGNDIDAGSFLDSIEPRKLDQSSTHWDVVLAYEPPGSSSSSNEEQRPDNDGNPQVDPALWEDDISEDSFTSSLPCETAKYYEGLKGTAAFLKKPGTIGPVTNSAGMLFSPGLEREAEVTVYRRSWYTANANTVEALRPLIGTINDDDFRIPRVDKGYLRTWKKYTARFKKATSRYRRINNFKRWENTVEVWIREWTWLSHLVDRGRYARAAPGDPDGQGGTISAGDIDPKQPPIRPLIALGGDNVLDEVLLNGDGQPLPAGSDPVYLIYSAYPEAKFVQGIYL